MVPEASIDEQTGTPTSEKQDQAILKGRAGEVDIEARDCGIHVLRASRYVCLLVERGA